MFGYHNIFFLTIELDVHTKWLVVFYSLNAVVYVFNFVYVLQCFKTLDSRRSGNFILSVLTFFGHFRLTGYKLVSGVG